MITIISWLGVVVICFNQRVMIRDQLSWFTKIPLYLQTYFIQLYFKNHLNVCVGVSIECTTLNNPSNGMVSIDISSYTTKLATYSCNSGFALQGNTYRFCIKNSYWSGVAPKCEGNALMKVT